MPHNSWTYEQDLAVLYGKITHGRAFNRHPDVQRLADAMGRTHAALCMRKGNFDALDCSVEVTGFRNWAKLTRQVWEEYKNNPDEVMDKAKAAYALMLSA